MYFAIHRYQGRIELRFASGVKGRYLQEDLAKGVGAEVLYRGEVSVTTPVGVKQIDAIFAAVEQANEKGALDATTLERTLSDIGGQ